MALRKATRAPEAPKRTQIVARKKKPVDRTPICDPAYLRRIDPVWMPGPVPPRFWEDRTHRRDYLLWLADRVGLRTMEDFYRLELSVCFKRELRSRAVLRIGAVRRSKRSEIVSPSMIGSHGSSRRFLKGFGTRWPIGGVTWIGWENAWDTGAWMTGMRLPSHDFVRNKGRGS